jgi:hypothetical protein
MSSTPFERPFVLPPADPRPDARSGTAALAVAVGLGLAAGLAAAIAVGVLLAVGAVGARLWSHREPATRFARWRPGIGWGLEEDGRWIPARVASGTRVYRRRVVLCLCAAEGPDHRQVLGPGSLGPTELRRLRVRLRLDHG